MLSVGNQQPSLIIRNKEGSTTKVYRSDLMDERPTDLTEFLLCTCGCGERVMKKGNKWLKGHNRRKYSHDPPLCACGCGLPIISQSYGKNRPKYVHGHYIKGHPLAGSCNGMFGKIPWNKGLTKETDSRVAKNAAGTSRSWLNRDRREVGVTYSKVGYREDLGTWFKSRWEANVARIFNLLGLKWRYEPRVFDLGEMAYAVDFHLPQLGRWVEVKGWMSDKDKRKISLARKLYRLILDVVDEPEYLKLQEKFSEYIPKWEFAKS